LAAVARSRSVLAALLVAALAGLRGAQTVDAVRQQPTDRQLVTFNEVSPIIYGRCASCHRTGQPAPFSLSTYDEVKLRAERISLVTKRRSMPPWPPEPGFGEFANPRVLSDVEIDLIQRWVADGAPEGNRAALPKPPAWVDEWQLGRPDLVLELPRSYTLPAAHGDVFRSFVIPIPVSSRRYVRGVEFRPSVDGSYFVPAFVPRSSAFQYTTST
jgi:mono/diheme cytochrome c family protein